ncbi:hypothetical protein Btru_021755 [Bulinus truncatus]|nr:hypothetical protein Btru_021755 [Bulinus truncatus]
MIQWHGNGTGVREWYRGTGMIQGYGNGTGAREWYRGTGMIQGYGNGTGAREWYGSYATVKRLVEVTKDINAENFEQKSAFFMACELGNRETIRALIEAGSNVKDIDIHLRNTIMMAAMHGYTDVVMDLIDKGVPLNCRDEERNTALHHACSNGHVSTVQVLLDNNVSVTCTNIHDQSPLCLAVDKRQTEVVMAMIEHCSWEESLSVRDKSGATCMDKMIANTPEAVKAVLDKCVQKSMHDPTHEEYKIEFNYKYIDPGPKDPMSMKYNYNALLTMVRHEREDLLLHDLCQSLMVYKWRRFGKAIFVLDSCLQMGYIILMIIFYLIMIKPNDPGYNCTATVNSSYNTSQWTENRPVYRHDVIWTVVFAIYAFSLALICRELKNALWVGWNCIRSFTFWMSMVSILLINLCLAPPGYEPCDNQWRLFAYGTSIFFIRESVMIQRFATLGLYFTMFFEVFKTMIKDGFQDPLRSMLSIISMTIGELNFRDNFIRGNNDPFNLDLYLLFPLFCVFMNLSLMNLMIGVAVGDINKVERRAYLTRLKTQIRYLLDAEVMPFMWLRQMVHTETVIVMPNLPPKSFLQKIQKKYLDGEQIMYMKKKMNIELTSDPVSNVQRELNQQKLKIEELSRMTRNILDVVTQLTRTVDKTEVTNDM